MQEIAMQKIAMQGIAMQEIAMQESAMQEIAMQEIDIIRIREEIERRDRKEKNPWNHTTITME